MNLIVVFPFGRFKRGERIVDPAEVAAILAGENARDVHKVPADAEISIPAAPAQVETPPTEAATAVTPAAVSIPTTA